MECQGVAAGNQGTFDSGSQFKLVLVVNLVGKLVNAVAGGEHDDGAVDVLVRVSEEFVVSVDRAIKDSSSNAVGRCWPLHSHFSLLQSSDSDFNYSFFAVLDDHFSRL